MSRKLLELEIDKIIPNPFQPRSALDEQGIFELAKTISKDGLIQPILVRPKGKKYELIAGERRWRACQKLGFETISGFVDDSIDNLKSARIAFTENFQRENLTAIEQAVALKKYKESFNLSLTQACSDLGMVAPEGSVLLKLLDSAPEVVDAVRNKKIIKNLAYQIIRIPIKYQKGLLEDAVNQKWSVDETRRRVNIWLNDFEQQRSFNRQPSKLNVKDFTDPEIEEKSKDLAVHFVKREQIKDVVEDIKRKGSSDSESDGIVKPDNNVEDVVETSDDNIVNKKMDTEIKDKYAAPNHSHLSKIPLKHLIMVEVDSIKNRQLMEKQLSDDETTFWIGTDIFDVLIDQLDDSERGFGAGLRGKQTGPFIKSSFK